MLPKNELLVSLYVEKKMSAKAITSELKRSGYDVTFGQVGGALKRLGVLRSRAVEIRRVGRYRDRSCGFCSDNFTPLTSTQKYCRRCIPDHEAGNRASIFGISQVEFDAMLQKQHNACAICLQSFENLKRNKFVIDHCHATEVIRGIVCANCNIMLRALDIENWFQKAKHYIEHNHGIVPIWNRGAT